MKARRFSAENVISLWGAEIICSLQFASLSWQGDFSFIWFVHLVCKTEGGDDSG
jgi:hypothetical protein